MSHPLDRRSFLRSAGGLGGIALVDPTSNHDLHATVLHPLGIDHTRLTFKHDGIERRLTDVRGHVLRPIVA